MPDAPLTPPDPTPPARRSPFEWSLAALRPADAEVARPSFMFKAGQASRERAVRFWRLVAGGLAVLMAVGGVAGYGLVQAEHQRAAALVAEARAVPVPVPAPTRPLPTLPESAATDPALVVSAPPLPRPVAAEAAEPTAAEIASALERRRDILVGGLGLIPDAPPVFAPEGPRGVPSYPGVLAAPRVQKKPSPVDPDPEPDDPR